MLASELIEKLQVRIERYGDLPVFDWDNDEIARIEFMQEESLAYGGCPANETRYPDRLILKQ